MADEQDNSKVINKKDPSFPDYLDFDKLRSEGIDYLGKLSGKIWTDHNVHDPGITILEALCYALLDLGYRTNLPVKDILATGQPSTPTDDNFLTPSQILTCNPLTITDFRKLLIDIEGVRNAWLEVATDMDVDEFCAPPLPGADANNVILNAAGMASPNEQPCCITYLNGLYHVYLELEKSKEDEITDAVKKAAFVRKVKQALMAHRNICEDFIDIRFMCKWEIGVCAEIELETGADAEEVYLGMMERLRTFFSPSPQFYNLSQLLGDKKKTIDEAFAGRPYNITESHGFVDTEELEQLVLRKSIHVSDVYNVLFSIPGIRKVQRLRLRNCRDGKALKGDEWVIGIPGNHVPEFSVACSGFQFVRQGIPLSFNFTKYAAILGMNFEHNGKILYSLPSEKLDTVIPDGHYRRDIDAYYSVQNEFPRVYGIGDGGLPNSAGTLRKAQALQLKGYLLFFDQLLANYLTQLKNIRGLFSLRPPGKQEDRKTYFANTLNSVPGIADLLRFPQDATVNAPGNEQPAFIAFPVSRPELETFTSAGKIGKLDIEKIKPFVFQTAAERDIAVRQLQEDAYNELIEFSQVTKEDGRIFFYGLGTSGDFAIIGTKYYNDISAARNAASGLLLAASIVSNYRKYFAAAQDKFSFNIELKIATYSQYLELIVEDEAGYLQRRQSFLSHLLSRFAEGFTDYALLSYGETTGVDLQRNDVRAREQFLSNYAGLSSNRGRAMNYPEDGWNSDNVSGFEKKFKALIGAPDLDRQSLCNFEVYKYDEKYVFHLQLAGRELFRSSQPFDSAQEAQDGARNLVTALSEPGSYKVVKPAFGKEYYIHVLYGEKEEAVFNQTYTDELAGKQTVERLYRLFSPSIVDGRSFVATYKYAPQLEDSSGKPVRIHVSRPGKEEEARGIALKSISKINDPGIWTKPAEEYIIGKLYSGTGKSGNGHFIDIEGFNIDINNTIIGKPDKFTYEVLDRNHRFKFESPNDFDSERKAREDCYHTLLLLTHSSNYSIEQDAGSGRWLIIISEGETRQAYSTGFHNWSAAEDARSEIRRIVRQHEFHLNVIAIPDTWQFHHLVGFEPSHVYTLQSLKSYDAKEASDEALGQFSEALATANAEKKKNEWVVTTIGKPAVGARLIVNPSGEDDDPIHAGEELGQLLSMQKSIRQLSNEQEREEIFARSVAIDEKSMCQYVYQLVDKDGLYAFYKEGNSDKAALEKTRRLLVRAADTGYDYLELNIHADTTIERKEWFHYQLRSSNEIARPGGGPPEKLILFESVRAYASREEAGQAFLDNYQAILVLAMDKLNYGDKKPISPVAVSPQTEDPNVKQENIVFIPADTLAYLGSYPEKGIEELIKVIKSYPIRSIRKKKDGKEFQERFQACMESGCGPEECDCCTGTEAPVYYFVLYDKQADTELWQSRQYFTTPGETNKSFRFFLLLLQYEGNFHIDCDCTGAFKIFIREVLAESVNRFRTPEHAWGKYGVQQFINVSQTGDSFYAYADADCCYKFFVACKNTRAVHPCTYDTSELRDQAMARLYERAEAMPSLGANHLCGKWTNEITGLDGAAIATVQFNTPSYIPSAAYLDEWLNLIVRICKCGLEVVDGHVFLGDPERSVRFEPIPGPASVSATGLRAQLLWIACYFPVNRGEDGRYCVEIRLPGFNSCEHCGDDDGKTESCHVAWMSECCYATCAEAVLAYNTIIGWIKNIHFYRKVFDCKCGPYGIVLHDREPVCVQDQRPAPGNTANGLPYNNGRPNSIVAYNPQCYGNPDMACDAIGRAKELINREGLQFVEHILLRPHCEEDCACRLQPCPNEFDRCQFPYWTDADEDDPCDTRMPVCFEPGHDPYSFIATVALPAWPVRFRKKQNRELVENILQREAPAHVLIRILWLAPHDLCCFEKHMKKWLVWMAYKRSCAPAYSTCEFVAFLFHQPFECLDDTVACDACVDNAVPGGTCVDEIRREEDATKNNTCHPIWFDQISEIFCWAKFNCTDYKYVDCDITVTGPPPPVPIVRVVPAPEKVEVAPAVAMAVPERQVGIDKVGKQKFVNARFASYKKAADEIVTATKGNKLAARARRFLDAASPSPDEFSTLIADLLKAWATRDTKKAAISRKQAQLLMERVIFFLLDKTCFNGQRMEDLEAGRKTFDAMRKAKMKMAMIYHDWGPAAVRKYEPKLDLPAIEKLITGQ